MFRIILLSFHCMEGEDKKAVLSISRQCRRRQKVADSSFSVPPIIGSQGMSVSCGRLYLGRNFRLLNAAAA
jgi:hypothetical protein